MSREIEEATKTFKIMYSQEVLPDSIQIVLALIGEELKSFKFFSTLRDLGLDDSFYQSNLSTLILIKSGFCIESDLVNDCYFGLLRRYGQKLEPNDVSVRKQSFAFYLDLIDFKKSISSAFT